MSDADTADLVLRAQRGDEAAFHALFRRHREVVARIVHRVMGPSPDHEDVVQDVFVQVYRSLGKFRGDAKFTTWLYRLAANVTKMHLRKKKSRPRFADVPLPDAPANSPGSPVTPHDAVARKRRIEALYTLVDRLSEKKRDVIVMHDFQGMSATEIGEHLEVSVLTVRTRLFYARKQLYASLADDPVLGQVVEGLLGRLPGQPKGQIKTTMKVRKRSSTPGRGGEL